MVEQLVDKPATKLVEKFGQPLTKIIPGTTYSGTEPVVEVAAEVELKAYTS